MVNIGFSYGTSIGLVLALFGLLLPFLGTVFGRPFRADNLTQDITFALVYILAGLILFFQGWRLDPILQITQLLLAGTAIISQSKIFGHVLKMLNQEFRLNLKQTPVRLLPQTTEWGF